MRQFRSLLPYISIKQMKQTQVIGFLLLLFGWFVLPFVLWLAVLGIYSLSFNNSKANFLLILLVSFSLSFLIASRYMGYLWGGADDMPSYLMAYQRYDALTQMLPVSLIYAKHADFAFGLYSWCVAQLSDNHAFFYYFLTLFITYLFIWKFFKIAQVPNPLLCFIFAVIFYKFFQGQWHLIRSYLALPILLSGLIYARSHFKFGAIIFFLGAMVHISTFVLLLPLFFVGRYLDKRWTALELIFIFIVLLLIAVGMIFSVKVIASISGHYIITKIVTRLEFSPGFSKLPSFLFFLIVNIIAIPGYLRTTNVSYIRLFNVTSFLSALAFIALFIMGEELHRILLPFYLLYGPLLVFSAFYFKPRFIVLFSLVIILTFHLLAFSYVIWLNESDFMYQMKTKEHPIEYIGIDYIQGMVEYLYNDIEYYEGYRIRK